MRKKIPGLRETGALTVIQPWAHIILHKGKIVENRQKNSHYRGTIAIHASSTKSKKWFEDCDFKFDPEDLSYGAIIGFVDLVDVITKKEVTSKTRRWFQGKYGYVFSNVVLLKTPVVVKGGRGLWRLKGNALSRCLEQLSASQVRKFKNFEKLAK